MNRQANKLLVKMFADRQYCEVGLKGCWHTSGLTFAHRKKRRFYSTADELADYNEAVVACINCHDFMEQNPDLTKSVFRRLRPDKKVFI